eukprot:9028639-Lingulodinium_polyedra.AAC.1
MHEAREAPTTTPDVPEQAICEEQAVPRLCPAARIAVVEWSGIARLKRMHANTRNTRGNVRYASSWASPFPPERDLPRPRPR